METALDEKQLLVREMNHRIKNNLAIVGALLTLQADRSPEPQVREELTRAVARINNFALVHDRLQLFTTSVAAIEAGPHFQELCHMLRSLLPQGVTLTPQCSGTIPGDAIESLTLIANELVTNAAKHAFTARGRGEIELGFRQEGAGWRLWVHDNGRGLPKQGDGPGFGRQMLAALAARVNAELRVATNGGTRIEVFSGLAR
jgi:two-component sensor histidine kinase